MRVSKPVRTEKKRRRDQQRAARGRRARGEFELVNDLLAFANSAKLEGERNEYGIPALPKEIKSCDPVKVVRSARQLVADFDSEFFENHNSEEKAIRVTLHALVTARRWLHLLIEGKRRELEREVNAALEPCDVHVQMQVVDGALREYRTVLTADPLDAAAIVTMLLLDKSRDYGRRLGQCSYRNCRKFFFHTTKIGFHQESCTGTNCGSMERQYRRREAEKKRSVSGASPASYTGPAVNE